MAPVIQRVVEDIDFGEGPHWDIATQSLYFVDYKSKSINRYDPVTKSHFKADIGDHYSSFIIPIEGQKDKFVIGVGRNISIVTWDGKAQSVEEINKLVEIDNPYAGNRLNDGKCDALGRLWTGTLGTNTIDITSENTEKTIEEMGADKSSPTGSFYSYGGDTLKKQFDGVGISNGIAWNKDNTKIFYIDTLKERIDQFDFDLKSGQISNRKELFSLKKHQIEGFPDGMTIDAEDNLWVATFEGNRVLKVSTTIPETLLDSIKLPAKQVTSAAWGGENLDELYVTTGHFNERGVTLDPVVDGSLYKITGLGTRGLPMNNFKL